MDLFKNNVGKIDRIIRVVVMKVVSVFALMINVLIYKLNHYSYYPVTTRGLLYT